MQDVITNVMKNLTKIVMKDVAKKGKFKPISLPFFVRREVEWRYGGNKSDENIIDLVKEYTKKHYIKADGFVTGKIDYTDRTKEYDDNDKGIELIAIQLYKRE
jgi:Zn-dependent alcohol dehydrogenase